MFLHSQTINSFIQRVKNTAKNIYLQEFYPRGLFLHHFHFEFHIVETKSTLAYYSTEFNSISLSEVLITSADEEFIKNILRHELVHVLCYESNPQDFERAPHGPQFHYFCGKLNYGPKVSQATANIPASNSSSNTANKTQQEIDFEKMMEKVQKLLSLSKSSNLHEAQSAAQMANSILEKYNLDVYYFEKKYSQENSSKKEHTTYSEYIFKRAKRDVKLVSIGGILTNFWVEIIYCSRDQGAYLCAIGEKHNIEIAKYIAGFLDIEFERLWCIASNNNPSLKGLRAKNSFYDGIREGYSSKIKEAQKKSKKSDPEIMNALTTIEKKLQESVKLVFPKLGTVQSSRLINRESLQLGIQAGKNLTIQTGISHQSSNSSNTTLCLN